MEKLLSVTEVAAVLGYSRHWVYVRTRSGELPSVKAGGRLRFSPSAIQAWLAERAAGDPVLPPPNVA